MCDNIKQMVTGNTTDTEHRTHKGSYIKKVGKVWTDIQKVEHLH